MNLRIVTFSNFIISFIKFVYKKQKQKQHRNGIRNQTCMASDGQADLGRKLSDITLGWAMKDILNLTYYLYFSSSLFKNFIQLLKSMVKNKRCSVKVGYITHIYPLQKKTTPNTHTFFLLLCKISFKKYSRGSALNFLLSFINY